MAWEMGSRVKINKLIESANTNKTGSSFIAVAQAYETVNGVERSRKDAIKWYKKSIAEGSIEGMQGLAFLYEGGRESVRSNKLAFNYHLQAAELGNVESQMAIGWKYYYGEGVEESELEAAKWFELAANSDEKSIYMSLLRIVGNLDSAGYNSEKADFWTNKIQNSNDPDLMMELAYSYRWGDGVEQSDKHSLDYLKKAYILGKQEALLGLAVSYSTGKGIRKNKNKNKSQEYLDKIFTGNNTDLITDVADKFEYGEELDQSDVLSFKWYKQAAKLGDPNSQMVVGRRYRDGKGTNKNFKSAEHWLARASDLGAGGASFSLASLHKNRAWSGRDEKKSLEFYQRALKQGISNSYSAIGWLYKEGVGVKKSYSTALKWFTKGLNNDDSRAHHAIAWMSFHGFGCEQSYLKAYEYYKISALSGHAKSMGGLGWLYESGRGCKKSLKKAKEWYEKGAEFKDDTSLNNLAAWYSEGKVVDKSSETALSLFRQAAELGSMAAYYNLAVRYALGEGVKKSVATARKYWALSVEKETDYLDGHFYRLYGRLHLEEVAGLKKEHAVTWFEKAIRYGDTEAHICLGEIYKHGLIVPQSGKKSVFHFNKAIQGGIFAAYNNLGNLYRIGAGVSKNHMKAKDAYLAAYENGVLNQKNNLAWMLATSRTGKVRDGELSIKFIKQAIRKHGNKAFRLDTLAAAHAETGNFALAVKVQKQAYKLLPDSIDDRERAEFMTRLEFYAKEKCWRE